MSVKKRPPVTAIPLEDSPQRPSSYHAPSPPQDIEGLPTQMFMHINNCNILVNADDLKLDDIIGEGHFSSVFKVNVPSAETKIAIKETHYIDHESSTVREIQNLQKCKSPFLVTCYGILQRQEYVLFCLELMDCSLKDLIDLITKKASFVKQPQLFSDDLISASAYSITSGLDYLKSLNVMHRDVKPSNVLIDRMGKIKLCDFGISVVLKNSVTGTMIGSQMYLSPERINLEKNVPYSWKSDVWALGLTLIELITGKYPYARDSGVYDLLCQIKKSDPPRLPPCSHSPYICEYVDKCLVKDVSARPTYRELLSLKLASIGAEVSSQFIGNTVAEILDS